MPRALQAKVAREMDRKIVLCKYPLFRVLRAAWYECYFDSKIPRQVDTSTQNKFGSESGRVSLISIASRYLHH